MTYTSDLLLDLHARGHKGLQALLAHCRVLTPEQIVQPLDGFGYANIRLQFHHVIGAEEYWIGVVQGRMDVDEDDAAYPTVDALEEFRSRVYAGTERYLRSASPEELSTARDMVTWHGDTPRLIPARVFLRTFTHIYHHQGQISAMCRILGHPLPPGLDFPLLDL